LSKTDSHHWRPHCGEPIKRKLSKGEGALTLLDVRRWHLTSRIYVLTVIQWRPLEAAGPVPSDAPQRIEVALRLLRHSRPLRATATEEIGLTLPSDHGLGEEALRVRVRGPAGAEFVIRSGAANPLGSGRYAHIDGVAVVPLLAGYVAERWQQAIGTAAP
jgi:hypothetical protein